MARRISLPAANVPTLEMLQQQNLVQGIENNLYSSNSNPEFGNSFDGITKKSRKQPEMGLAYSLLIFFEKRTRFFSKLQIKSENMNAVIQSRLNVRTVNEELNRYDYSDYI